MRRPWIEAEALLASRPHSCQTVTDTPLPPPAPQIAPEIRFAILEKPYDTRNKPRAYPDARRLARWIDRRRRGRPIQCETARIRLREGATQRGVLIYAEDGVDPREFIGWAWLSGQGQMALQDALRAFDRMGVAA